jgi:hypothetical protein
VFLANTKTKATVFNESGTALETGDMKTDSRGKFGFAAPNGVYDVETLVGTGTDTIESVGFYDPNDLTYSTVAAFTTAAPSLNSPDGTVVTAGPVQFQADSSAAIAGLPAGWKPFGKVRGEHWGTPGTPTIQAAIDYQNSIGGGTVHIYEDVTFVASTLSDTIYLITAPGVTENRAASDHCCLLLRSGVTIAIHNGATLTFDDTKIAISMLDMEFGGVFGVGARGRLTSGTTTTAAGHCIQYNISETGRTNRNIVVDNLEIFEFGSYGLGGQYGDYENNVHTRLWIHDTGADGIDYKVRAGAEIKSRASRFDNIWIQRHSLRTSNAAGIDLRGPATVSNLWVTNFSSANDPVGFRFAAGIFGEIDERESSSYASLSNFYIDSEDPSVDDIVGIDLFSAKGITVSNGTVRNCRRAGIRVGNAGSGNGELSRFSAFSNVMVEACWTAGCVSNEEHVTFDGVRVVGQMDLVSASAGNLEAAQTALVTERPHNAATVEVYEDGSLLTEGVDYTVTNATTITLSAGAAGTEVFWIVTPTTVGFDINSAQNGLSICRTRWCTIPKSYATGEIIEVGCDFQSGYTTSLSGDTPSIRAEGPLDDYDFELFSKGTGAVVLRNGEGRLYRAIAETDAVNWSQSTASATGNAVKLAAAGSDTDIDLLLEPKGTGKVRIGTHASIGAETVTGYIEIKDAGGTLRKVAVVS